MSMHAKKHAFTLSHALIFENRNIYRERAQERRLPYKDATHTLTCKRQKEGCVPLLFCLEHSSQPHFCHNIENCVCRHYKGIHTVGPACSLALSDHPGPQRQSGLMLHQGPWIPLSFPLLDVHRCSTGFSASIMEKVLYMIEYVMALFLKQRISKL